MRIKTVSVEYQRTINLGNYSSAKLGISLHADLESTDSEDLAIAQLQEQARHAVKEEYQRLMSKVPANAERNGS